MRVLVTGGTGFIGSRVAAAASARGHDVRLLGRRAPSQGRWPFIAHDLVHQAGLADLMRGVDAVIHCAAAMDGSAETQWASTVDGTHNLVAAMAAASVNRIVLVSTFAVYDCASIPPGDILTEDTALDLASHARGPYVRAKIEQERLVRSAHPALRWTIVRPGLVFGPGRTWFYHLGMRLSGRLWLSLAGAGTLPLTWIDNCAAAIASSLDAPQSEGRTINLVDNDLPSRSWYMNRIALHESRQPTVLDVPWSALSAAARTAWFGTHGLLRDRLTPPGILHPSVLAARCKPLRYDNALAKQLLGWTPDVSVEDGLAQSR